MSTVNVATGEAVEVAEREGRQVMPSIEAEIRSALVDSIKRFGVLVPIAVDQHGGIIDGHNRWDIAHDLNVPCPTLSYQVESEEHAAELAATLNMDRRQLDRETRRAVAKSLREDGHSLRAIAGALGVAPNTVRADLGGELATVQDCTVASDEAEPEEPQRVVGVDGRSQPATRRGPWSPDELVALLDRVEAGESRDDLAAEHGISRSNLGSLLTRARKLRKGETPMDKVTRVAEEIRVAQISEAAAEGLSSRQIAERLELSFQRVRLIASRNGIDVPADAVVGKAPRIQSQRVAAETVNTLEGVASSLRLVDPADLDPADCGEWVTSLSESLKVLTRFRNQLKEMTRESE